MPDKKLKTMIPSKLSKTQETTDGQFNEMSKIIHDLSEKFNTNIHH
jgi:hypothetical protein